MTDMVFGKKKPALPVKSGRELLQCGEDNILLEQLLLDPDRNRHWERAIALRCKCEVGIEEPLKLEEWLLVEHNIVHVVELDSAFCKAVANRMYGKAGVLLLASEAFLLRCRSYASLEERRRGAIVLER